MLLRRREGPAGGDRLDDLAGDDGGGGLGQEALDLGEETVYDLEFAR